MVGEGQRGSLLLSQGTRYVGQALAALRVSHTLRDEDPLAGGDPCERNLRFPLFWLLWHCRQDEHMRSRVS